MIFLWVAGYVLSGVLSVSVLLSFDVLAEKDLEELGLVFLTAPLVITFLLGVLVVSTVMNFYEEYVEEAIRGRGRSCFLRSALRPVTAVLRFFGGVAVRISPVLNLKVFYED